jgi:hypothetical protein
MVLTVSFVLSPGTGSLAPVDRRIIKRGNLSASTGAPEPHDFSVRTMSFVRAQTTRCDMSRPSHPTPRVVTIAIRPSCRGGTRGKMLVICPTTQGDNVRQSNTTGKLRMALMRELPVVQCSMGTTILFVIASAAKQSRLLLRRDSGLLRCARNDG